MFKLKNGLIAMESVLGWTLSGEFPSQISSSCALTVISMLTEGEHSIQDMWSLDALGIGDTAEQRNENEHNLQVQKTLQESVTRDRDGRYVVKLSWIDQSLELPSNREVAKKRLEKATEKLEKQGGLEAYGEVFRGCEKEGIIEEVRPKSSNMDIREDSISGHFLPHRPVFKPESLTTPIRPVFDASCRVGNNPSLNQCLEKGPNLLELIPSVLHRFRQKRIGAIADIRKAFQMVGVGEEDKNYQKFLWWEDKSKNILKEYRHCRVVFGLNCSPFILAAVLNLHLSQVTDGRRPVAKLLKTSLYVDNVVASLDEEEQYRKFKEESVAILDEAKMELRQWESNLDKSSDSITTVLGLEWKKNEDTLSCKVPEINLKDMKVTKRKVLSLVSQVYDPIGFLCPALLQPKIMIQNSWAVDNNWDREWSHEESDKFLNWAGEMSELRKICIPRNAFGDFERDRIQIHLFCDASRDAYAAIVFVRVDILGRVAVQLLQAKSRVAPLDKKKQRRVTIPRLELMGCLIGSRLTQSVKESLTLAEVPTFYWSDSTTALAWIERDEDWGTFVGNRVREINRLTRKEDWRFVPGCLNPADLPSRGCSPTQLLDSIWWEGPEWLKENEDKWQKSMRLVDEEAVWNEAKKSVTNLANIPAVDKVQPKFSSYLKNVGVAAWIRRFIGNCRKSPKNRFKRKHLTVDELRKGEMDIIRAIQKHHYPIAPVIKALQVKKEEDRLFHVKTRIALLEDATLFRSPILLPKDNELVVQLIKYVHRSNCHAGAQFVLGKIREKFWIPQGRRTVSKVIQNCVICRRHNVKNVPCDPAPLPKNRIQAQFAFQTTGIDLAGPLILKGGKKAWIVIYTCAVYRCVYLDIVSSISTEEFLDSLEKFTLLIGRPNTIYTDNGTNFVGANNLLKNLDMEKFSSKGINWIFNPPAAPWWGGWWERLIRTLKELLRKMIGNAKLSLKDLEKCLASLSYTINNRPLTTLTEDVDDLVPLTPAMFMKDLPVGGMPELDDITSRDLQGAYQKVRNLRTALDNRFRKEYLGQLVQRRQETGMIPLQVGDTVLIGSDNKKRYEWPLARVIELFPGKDQKIRVAKLKTANGILLRPLQRLYQLEMRNPESIEDPIVEKIPAEKIISGKKTRNQGGTDRKEVVGDSQIPPVRTRGGRISKVPVRYGSWNK